MDCHSHPDPASPEAVAVPIHGSSGGREPSALRFRGYFFGRVTGPTGYASTHHFKSACKA